MADFFSNNQHNEISGGEFLAAAGSPDTFFKNSSNLKISGGRYGTLGLTNAAQTSVGTSSSATRSSTLSQDGSEGVESLPARRATGTVLQEAPPPPYATKPRRGAGGPILTSPHQVANDPESYDTSQPRQSLPSSASSAPRNNTAPSSTKDHSGTSEDGTHGVRSSSKSQTNPAWQTKAPSSRERNSTAPPSTDRKREDSIAPQGDPDPPPLPPKPKELIRESSHTQPPPTNRTPNVDRGGPYRPSTPPQPVHTGATGYPSPLPSPPHGRAYAQSPPESPHLLRNSQPLSNYHSSPAASSFSPRTPHRQSLPFRSPDAPGMGPYPSPGPTPPGYGGSYFSPAGEGQRGYAPAGSFPSQGLPSSPTPSSGRRHQHQLSVDLMQWSKSEPPFDGHGRNAPMMNRSTTMPVPMHFNSPAAPTGPTHGPTPFGGSQNYPYGHDGGPPYNSPTDYAHHGGQTSPAMPAPQPPYHQANYFPGPSGSSQEQAPSFPMPHI